MLINVKDIISGESIADSVSDSDVRESHNAHIESLSRDFNSDANDLIDECDRLDRAINKLDELDEDMNTISCIHCLMEESLEEERYVDEVSAEMLNVLINGIRERNKLPMSHITTLISEENFKGTITGRKTNHELAIEAIGDFFKGVWEKIVKAISAVLKYLKDFWMKNISIIGRLRKTIAKLISRAKNIQGEPTPKDNMSAPSGFVKGFVVTSGDVSISSADVITNRHIDVMDNLFKALKVIKDITSNVVKGLDKVKLSDNPNKVDRNDRRLEKSTGVSSNSDPGVSDNLDESENHLELIKIDTGIDMGSEKEPLAGGEYCTMKASILDGKLELEVKWDKAEIRSEDGIEWIIAESNEMVKSLTYCDELLEISMKLGDIVRRLSKEIDVAMGKAKNKLNRIGDKVSKESKDHVKKYLDAYRTISSAIPKLSSKFVSLNIKLSKQVVNYCKMSMKLHIVD